VNPAYPFWSSGKSQNIRTVYQHYHHEELDEAARRLAKPGRGSQYIKHYNKITSDRLESLAASDPARFEFFKQKAKEWNQTCVPDDVAHENRENNLVPSARAFCDYMDQTFAATVVMFIGWHDPEDNMAKTSWFVLSLIAMVPLQQLIKLLIGTKAWLLANASPM
jgi:hypothetical protein